MAYDSQRSRTVLFRGSQYGDTWEWDGNTWTVKFLSPSPPFRAYHALAYDSARGRIVLFGGGRDDTWEYDGTAWTQANPSQHPGNKSYHGMAYDAARGRVVLHGRGDGPTPAETWEWDGSTWLLRQPAQNPLGQDMLLACDTLRRRVVLVAQPTETVFETWEWDGLVWTRLKPATSPWGVITRRSPSTPLAASRVVWRRHLVWRLQRHLGMGRHELVQTRATGVPAGALPARLGLRRGAQTGRDVWGPYADSAIAVPRRDLGIRRQHVDPAPVRPESAGSVRERAGI
jgi:hypothetical protein